MVCYSDIATKGTDCNGFARLIKRMAPMAVCLVALLSALPSSVNSVEPINSAFVSVQQQVLIPVTASQQNGFSRVVVNFPVEVPFRVRKTGTRLDIVFEAAFTPQFSAAVSNGLQQFSNANFSGANETTTLSLTVASEAYARQRRSGTSVVIDIYPQTPASVLERARLMQQRFGQKNPRTNNPVQARPKEDVKPKTVIDADKKDTPVTKTVNGPAPRNATLPKPSTAITQNPNTDGAKSTDENAAKDSAKNDTLNKSVKIGKLDTVKGAVNDVNKPTDTGRRNVNGVINGNLTLEAKAKKTKQGPEYKQGTAKSVKKDGDLDVNVKVTEKTKGVVFRTNNKAQNDGAKLEVNVTALPNLAGVSFAFSMPALTATAAFERYGNLWIVFDGKMNFDSQGLIDAKSILEGRVQGVYPVEHKDATILRMAIRANQNIVMEVIENRWVLQLKDTPTRPRFPLAPQRRNDSRNGNHVFIEASQIGTKLTFEDPTIGDELVVLPLLGMGRGVSFKRNYAEAVLLKTAQGVAIEPLSDKVLVNRFRTGIAVKTEVLSRTGPQATILAQKIVDFDAWRIGKPEEYRKHKARLVLRQSLADKGERNKIRWDLARFYLGHNRAGEALGVLSLMVKEDPTVERTGEFLAVRGIANFRLGRMVESGNDLFKPTLNGEQDIELWRAMIKEDRGRTKDTLDHYRRGKDVIGGYFASDRAEIQLAVIRAALQEEDFKLAEQELDLFDDIKEGGVKIRQRTEAKYLRGMLAEAQGKQSEALSIYDQIANDRDRKLNAHARYSRVKHNMKMGDISDKEAMYQLERLKYAWRGPKFESKVTSDLVDLYIKGKKYNSAFEIVKNDTPYFQSEANEYKLSERMRGLFKQLFFHGDADNLEPIKAVAMFFNYQEYNSRGSEGDRIVLKLADRLEQMDLLDKAAELYMHMITSRVQTQTGKSELAADLARIYIMDRKPEKALDIISATRQAGLPQDIVNERRWVEAKAMIEMGKYEEAEVHLEDDGSKIAQELRADLYWSSHDWPKVVTSSQVYLGGGWSRNEPLDAKQRIYLIRACIGMKFGQDNDGLAQMRQRYGRLMRAGDLSTAFELLTNGQENLSGVELSSIVEQIASINKLRTFMRDYKKDFTNKSATGS